MGLLDEMRGRRAVRRLRGEPALIVPDADPARVEAYVRQWCPDTDRRPDGVLATPDGTQLHGPFDRAHPAWPDAEAPSEYRAAYVARHELGSPGGSWADPTTRFNLLDGLARRLSGRVRQRPGERWTDPTIEPAAPMVLAPRALPPDEAIALLAPLYPGIELAEDEDGSYVLQTDGVVLDADLRAPLIFPLARLQPWFTGEADTSEYFLAYGVTDEDLRVMADAARAIARATGGLILDEDGFPWRDASR